MRPNAQRSSSSKLKRRPGAKSSKLSFGADGGEGGDTSLASTEAPRKAPLGQRTLEHNVLKRGMAARGLPVRSLEEDEERPLYSKEYLSELQSSTMSTPQNVAALHDDSDGMDLDPAELEGAVIVESPIVTKPAPLGTAILSEAEIREKKERRARLAKEQDFLSVEDEDEEDDDRKKKDDTRLVAEDEDMGEGFDEFVEDGGMSLGKRAEKERRKQQRKQMAEMINAAEGHSSDASSDSDAERRIAYEAAQSRAGLDGLKKPRKDPSEELLQVPPKITPLPSLSECLLRLQGSLKGMEDDIRNKNSRVQQLHEEVDEIAEREGEVQALLDETGKKYQEAMGKGDVKEEAAMASGLASELIVERGLESLGATPSRPPPEEDEPS